MAGPTLIIATNNPDKVREIREILTRSDIAILSAGDFDDFPEIEESGQTLVENAILKAEAVWQKYHLPSLADDTGLEVECLNGEPGAHSSRYAGPHASYDENCNKLLAEIARRKCQSGKAWFRTVVAFVDARGNLATAEGALEGEIISVKRGDNGFGYDPIFLVPELGMTLAELDPAEKNRISHRHRALLNILPGVLAGLA